MNIKKTYLAVLFWECCAHDFATLAKFSTPLSLFFSFFCFLVLYSYVRDRGKGSRAAKILNQYLKKKRKEGKKKNGRVKFFFSFHLCLGRKMMTCIIMGLSSTFIYVHRRFGKLT